jgi:hypothetical protein
VDRGLLRWICVVVGLVLAFLWLYTEVTGGAVVGWVPPASVIALALAAALAAL